jgi:8-oxo-dGTP diphosphatase
LLELNPVYGALLGEAIKPVSFRRKMDEFGIAESIPGAKRAEGTHRPAQLLRLRGAHRRTLGWMSRGLSLGWTRLRGTMGRAEQTNGVT